MSPLDALGLQRVLAALNCIPRGLPATHVDPWATLATAVALFAPARAIALLALRRLLHWRVASESWRKIAASCRSHTH